MEIKFLWTEDMSVNNDVIDAQHQELFKNINELLDAIVNEKAEDMVSDMVKFFKDYMDQHFSFEEQYLIDNGYPHALDHKEKHDVFVKKYHELRGKIDEGYDKDRIVLDIENFMGSWLTQHILIEDHLYAQYFAEKKLNQ
jgi:hemerythrin